LKAKQSKSFGKRQEQTPYKLNGKKVFRFLHLRMPINDIIIKLEKCNMDKTGNIKTMMYYPITLLKGLTF
jgi:hypothetical protein